VRNQSVSAKSHPGVEYRVPGPEGSGTGVPQCTLTFAQAFPWFDSTPLPMPGKTRPGHIRSPPRSGRNGLIRIARVSGSHRPRLLITRRTVLAAGTRASSEEAIAHPLSLRESTHAPFRLETDWTSKLLGYFSTGSATNLYIKAMD